MKKKKKQSVKPNMDKYKGIKENNVKIIITENNIKKTISL